MRLSFGLLVATMLLGACAGDNPDNVPEYGEWEIETRLASVSIDGQVLAPSMIPEPMTAMNGTEQRCGEPMFINRDWQQNDINRRVKGDCTLASYEVTPARVVGTGKCVNVAPEADFEPEFELTINQQPQSYRMTLTMKGLAKFPGESVSRYLEASAIQEGRRSGPC